MNGKLSILPPWPWKRHSRSSLPRSKAGAGAKRVKPSPGTDGLTRSKSSKHAAVKTRRRLLAMKRTETRLFQVTHKQPRRRGCCVGRNARPCLGVWGEDASISAPLVTYLHTHNETTIAIPSGNGIVARQRPALEQQSAQLQAPSCAWHVLLSHAPRCPRLSIPSSAPDA